MHETTNSIMCVTFQFVFKIQHQFCLRAEYYVYVIFEGEIPSYI